ncbi:hypothetical protein AcV7_008594 [Taiwanofungus camphoratus]|nr:hypothetical protein AcV7_008594 [Antrodia cinnamomea]
MAAPAGFCALPLSITQLSLAAVLQCGQSFRWSIFPLVAPLDSSSPTHEYRLCLHDRVVCLRQSPDVLFYRSVFPGPLPPPKVVEEREAQTLTWVHDYFQLDIDLVRLYKEWSDRDPVFHSYRQRFVGIRMLRQDPFENLVSFICSSNNNISRITKMVKALCQHYSPPLLVLPAPGTSLEEKVPMQAYHPFPPPSILAAPTVSTTLRGLGFGYRADFIQKTANMLIDAHGSSKHEEGTLEPAEKWLHSLRQVSTSQAREELMKFVGVGRKVADCILLMSLDKKEVIPVDTHVHQIAAKHYCINASSKGKVAMTPKVYDEVSSKLAAVWGDYAGWAHSVLFTSDLKSFSSYGLPSPSPTPSVQPAQERTQTSPQRKSRLITPPATPSSSPSKRKRSRPLQDPPKKGIVVKNEQAESLSSFNSLQSADGEGLADRVKRRRRVKSVDLSVSR